MLLFLNLQGLNLLIVTQLKFMTLKFYKCIDEQKDSY